MMTRRNISAILLAVSALSIAFSTTAQKTTRRNLKPAATAEAVSMADTIYIADQSQIAISGYDKPLRSNKETFFVTNHTGRDISSIALQITYLDSKGRQLHQRDCTVAIDIPQGATRRAAIKSWDLQNSFYYRLSTRPRRDNATPYDVKCSVRFITSDK